MSIYGQSICSADVFKTNYLLRLTFNHVMLFLQPRQRNPEPLLVPLAPLPQPTQGEMCHKDVGCGIGFAVSPSGAAVSVTFCSCQNPPTPTPLLSALDFLEI